MNEQHDGSKSAGAARASWQRPVVQRLRAGDAELFTRETTKDGGFSNS